MARGGLPSGHLEKLYDDNGLVTSSREARERLVNILNTVVVVVVVVHTIAI